MPESPPKKRKAKRLRLEEDRTIALLPYALLMLHTYLREGASRTYGNLARFRTRHEAYQSATDPTIRRNADGQVNAVRDVTHSEDNLTINALREGGIYDGDPLKIRILEHQSNTDITNLADTLNMNERFALRFWDDDTTLTECFPFVELPPLQ